MRKQKPRKVNKLQKSRWLDFKPQVFNLYPTLAPQHLPRGGCGKVRMNGGRGFPGLTSHSAEPPRPMSVHYWLNGSTGTHLSFTTSPSHLALRPPNGAISLWVCTRSNNCPFTPQSQQGLGISLVQGHESRGGVWTSLSGNNYTNQYTVVCLSTFVILCY